MRHEAVRHAMLAAMTALQAIVPEGREKSLVFTKLEEAMFWANAGIARNHEALEMAPSVGGRGQTG